MKFRDWSSPAKPLQVRRGYSLIEVMVVVAILGLLAAAATPSFVQLKQRQEVNAMVTALGADIRLTKTEAVKRGRRVTMCPTERPNDDLPVCGNGGDDWANGWLVFVDDGQTLGALDPGETIVRVQQAFSGEGTIFNNALTAMSFQATGLPVGLLASSFVVTPDAESAESSPLSTSLILSGPGRVTVKKYKP
jgi:type IV fimbrial biogenesis protein FimT